MSALAMGGSCVLGRNESDTDMSYPAAAFSFSSSAIPCDPGTGKLGKCCPKFVEEASVPQFSGAQIAS